MKTAITSKLAKLGGEKTITEPLAVWPQYDQSEREALIKALEGSIGCASQGRAVGFTVEFEKKFAQHHHLKFGVNCFNCTVGLEAALAIAGLGPDDEVIVSPYTFFASVSSVIRTGAVPVFSDIDPKTMCIDIAGLEKLRTPRTKAVMPVHFAGYIDDMPRLKAWADQHQILVIEDAAQAQGTCRDGKYAGAFGVGAVFSFQRNKNMSAGEGGMFLTDDEKYEKAFREFIWHGTRQQGADGHHSITTNLRMTEFQSAILLEQLAKLDRQNKKRMQECDRLDELMRNIPGFEPLDYDPLDVHARHLYIFKMDRKFWGHVSKKVLLECLNAEGVRCSGGYPHPNYQYPAFVNQNFPKWYKVANQSAFDAGRLDFSKLRLPQVEQACQDVFLMPHFVFLSDFNIGEKIAAALAKVSENKDIIATL